MRIVNAININSEQINNNNNLKLFFTIKDQLTAVGNNIGQSKQTVLNL